MSHIAGTKNLTAAATHFAFPLPDAGLARSRPRLQANPLVRGLVDDLAEKLSVLRDDPLLRSPFR